MKVITLKTIQHECVDCGSLLEVTEEDLDHLVWIGNGSAHGDKQVGAFHCCVCGHSLWDRRTTAWKQPVVQLPSS